MEHSDGELSAALVVLLLTISWLAEVTTGWPLLLVLVAASTLVVETLVDSATDEAEVRGCEVKSSGGTELSASSATAGGTQSSRTDSFCVFIGKATQKVPAGQV